MRLVLKYIYLGSLNIKRLFRSYIKKWVPQGASVGRYDPPVWGLMMTSHPYQGSCPQPSTLHTFWLDIFMGRISNMRSGARENMHGIINFVSLQNAPPLFLTLTHPLSYAHKMVFHIFCIHFWD